MWAFGGGVAAMLLFHAVLLGLGFLLGKSGNTSAGAAHTHHPMPGMSVLTQNNAAKFHLSPAPTDASHTECFFINQADFSYVLGTTKVDGSSEEAATVLCVPASAGQTTPGVYEAYLRYSGADGPATAQLTTTIE